MACGVSWGKNWRMMVRFYSGLLLMAYLYIRGSPFPWYFTLIRLGFFSFLSFYVLANFSVAGLSFYEERIFFIFSHHIRLIFFWLAILRTPLFTDYYWCIVEAFGAFLCALPLDMFCHLHTVSGAFRIPLCSSTTTIMHQYSQVQCPKFWPSIIAYCTAEVYGSLESHVCITGLLCLMQCMTL